MSPDYNEQVGARLRAVRRQRRLSLQDVQRLTGGEFKAAVVGAYERGERSLSLPRLQRLADFFQAPVTHFLPEEKAEDAAVSALPTGGITIDLNALDKLGGADAEVFERFLRRIQMLRQDFNGKVLTIREDDLRTLSLLLDEGGSAFADRLTDMGLTTD